MFRFFKAPTIKLHRTPVAKQDDTPLLKTIPDHDRDEALEAAHAALPACYKLTGFKHEDVVKFVAFGCQGTAEPSQTLVGKKIAEMIDADPSTAPDFILLLGDNLYPEGAKGPRSKGFINSFYKPYHDLIQKKLPFFVITGNHDFNFRDEAALPFQEGGLKRVTNEVAHTYLPDAHHTVADKVAVYQQQALDVRTLPTWNMPSRYYALDIGKTRIFCVDSSTYIADFLQMNDASQTANNNQAIWLQTAYRGAKESQMKCVIALHHPLYSPGKRAFKNDLRLYLTIEQRQAIRQQFPRPDKHYSSYNVYLLECLKHQALNFDFNLSAHDHNQYYFNNGQMKQLTLGGGGGPTQNRCEFGQQQNMGFFTKQFGYGTLEMTLHDPAAPITFKVHTTQGNTLAFTDRTHLAEYSPQNDTEVSRVIQAIEKAIHTYFEFIQSKQNEDRTHFLSFNKNHGTSVIEGVHTLWLKIHLDKQYDYKEFIKMVHDQCAAIQPWGGVSEHGFMNHLNQALSATFQEPTSLEALYKKTLIDEEVYEMRTLSLST